ncbi:MAG TPA: phage tail sheath subtilisin-like domain-containing protein [Dissulfurispiraceae bacterium]|nr:phage tail sheath subtilisin-like domain-containing protein [Dissulfurispiraceae bacterium]
MPEYLSPGVYVEEIEIGAKPIEGVSTSTAGFLGPTERGPEGPRLITGFEQFKRLYGGYLANSFFAYGVEGFFTNGGQRCFVGRIAATAAAATSADVTAEINVEAIGPGIWGNRVAVKLERGSLNSGTTPVFKLTVMYWSQTPPTPVVDPTNPANATNPNRREPDLIEVYDNLTDDQTSINYYENRINPQSSIVRVTRLAAGLPADHALSLLTDFGGAVSGSDGPALALVDYQGRTLTWPDGTTSRTGFLGFREVDEISIVVVPDHHAVANLTTEIVTQCTQLKDRFAVLHSNPATDSLATIGTLRPPQDTSYGAFYFPWIKVYDPRTKTDLLVPPSGHVAGIYAKTDIERGVHKAPANEVVIGATALQFQITKGEQDILNPRGVNCLRVFPGRGLRVWGARTASSNPILKYVSVRRFLLYLEESIDEGTQWVVFEPNNEKLWGRVIATITEFLTRVWRDGALMGTKPEQAFFVKCDRTTMTQDDIDNGRLICIIGVATVKPAEFVIFRIAQWAGGSSVTE